MKKCATLANGTVIETRPGADWTLIWIDPDDPRGDPESGMAIFGVKNVDEALKEVRLSFFPPPGYDYPDGIVHRALYMDREASFMSAVLSASRHESGCLVAYQVVSTGIRKWFHLDVRTISEALITAQFPEVPPDETRDDYVDVLGLVQTSVTPSAIIK